MKTLHQYLVDEGTTQRKFAALVNVSPSHLSEILSGAKTPSLKVAVRIAEATGGAVSEASLFSGGRNG